MYYAGKRYLEERGEQGGDRRSKGHFDPLNGNTSKQVAHELGVCPRTVERAETRYGTNQYTRGVPIIGTPPSTFVADTATKTGQSQRAATLPGPSIPYPPMPGHKYVRGTG